MILVETYRKARKFAWFLPGFLLYASFPPMGEVADILFALAPLLWLSRQGDPRTAAWRWFQSGIFFWVATLSWMPAIVKSGGPWPLVVLGWGALAAYCSLYFAAFGYLSAAYWGWSRAKGSPTLARLGGILLVEPILWCGLELVRSRFLGGFAWNQLGVVPVNAGFGAPAAIGGVYLLSAVVLLVNGTFAGVAERMVATFRARLGKSYDASALNRMRSVETLLALALVWGVYQIPGARPAGDPAADSVKVALVQRNFPCVFQAKEDDPHEVYGRLLANLLPLQPDLVVLPESAMSEFGPVDSPRAVAFAEGVSKVSGCVLAGGTRFGDGETFNSAALYDGGEIQVYDKVHLVSFGEFIPGDKWFPILQKLAPVGSCTPGEERLLTLPKEKVPFGVAICFEDTDSALVRRFAAAGARFLCFITNDSWFSHSNEAMAHVWQATARAIETGLPVVRVGNSGVSGTILPDGRRTWLLGPDGRPLVDRAGTMFDRLPIQAVPPTPYVRFGDAPLFVAFLLLIGAMILVKYRNTYGKHRTLSL